MYIVVVGGGQVGHYLTKVLVNDGHEVLVIEKEAKKCQRIAEEMGKSIVMRGDGCEAATLEEAGTGRADMLIAVTGDDEDNLVACQVAKHKFRVPRTIARVKNPENEPVLKKLGVDVTVSGTSIILAHIEQELPSHPLIPLLRTRGGGLEVVEVKIAPHSNMVGKRLGDIPLPSESLVSLVIGKEKGARIPNKATILEAEDEIVAVTKPELEEELRAALTGE